MDILKRLEMANAATQPVRALWIDHLSVDCQMFVCEAATLFRNGRTSLRHSADLYRSLTDIIHEDYTEDTQQWPGISAFVRWIQASELRMPAKRKQPNQSANTNRLSKVKPKKDSISASNRSTASKRQTKPSKKRA